VWARLGARLLTVAGLLSVILAAACLTAASAGARVVRDRATGKTLGIVPVPPMAPAHSLGANPVSASASATPTCSSQVDPTCSAPLTNRDRGPVQHAERDYLFLWDPGSTLPSGYVAGLQRWLNDLAAADYRTGHVSGTATGNPVSVVQQYYDFSGPHGTKRFVPDAVQDGGTITDRGPYPAKHCTDTYTHWAGGHELSYPLPQCLTVGQIQTELHRYIRLRHLPVGIDTEYFVITPPGVGDCADSTSSTCADQSYCGIHTTTGSGRYQIVYAVLPWLQKSTCDVSQTGTAPVHSAAVDTTVGIFSHELSESMTDPDLDGWRGPGGSGDEVGDKCAYQYAVGQTYFSFAGLPRAGRSYYNATLRGDHYLLQMEYDNWAHGCSQWDTQPQPVARISTPARIRAGRAWTFSLVHVSDPVGVAYVEWILGDGRTAQRTGGHSIRHSYARPGRYTVTALITDHAGNEVAETATVRVVNRRR
jgi:hypothetical protein